MTGDRGILNLIWIFCASVSPASPPNIKVKRAYLALAKNPIALRLTEYSHFIDIRYFISLVLVDSGFPCQIIFVRSECVSGHYSGSNSWQTVIINGLAPYRILFHISAHTEMQTWIRQRLDSSSFSLQVEGVGFVNGTITESSLVSRLVQDHGVLHIVTGIRDDGDDRISSVREVVKSVLVVQARSDDRGLTGLKTILAYDIGLKAIL
jgi:hypothetical protein